MADSYEVEPEPIKPDLPGEVKLCAGAEEIVDAVAADLFIQATACVREFGDFHLAITGGRLIEQLFLRLMVDPLYRGLPWTRTQLWVAAASTGEAIHSGATIIEEVLQHHAGIPHSQIHITDADEPDAHESYERELLETLGWREKGHDRLDFVVMGVNDEEPVFGRSEDLAGGRVVSRFLTHGGVGRVSMTPWFVSGARFIALLASGVECQPIIQAAMRRGTIPLAPVGGVQRWYLDQAFLEGRG